MEDEFEIPIIFNGEEQSFPARFINYGYSIKLELEIDDTKVLFEPDEERNWRALISFEELQANKKLNVDLLKAIAETIEELTK